MILIKGLILIKKDVDLFEQGVDGLVGVDGGYFLALSIDNGVVFAAAKCDVGAVSFAGSIDYAAHDGDGEGLFDGCQGEFDFFDHFDEVDFGAAAGGAGDEFGGVFLAEA